MPKPIRETSTLAAAAETAAGRYLIQFISPGWGSSGYYSPEVLSEAAEQRIIPAGTHMYADHPTESESIERPERSIRDLMAVTVEDARLSADGALVGEVQVVPQWRDTVEAVRDAIGVSIWGDATNIYEGQADGRTGRIIEGLAHVQSVDFVTRPGRGGKVLQLLESARATSRARARGLSEATVNDTREALQIALVDAHGGDKVYVWVRDFDDTTVWFEVEDADGSGIYAQSYTQDADGAVELTGDRTEVRVQTSYVPVDEAADGDTPTPTGVPATRPDGNTTEESQEDTMPKIQIEESEHTRLVEAAGRVGTLESERDTAVRERDEARGQLAERDRRDRATVLIGERAAAAGVTFDQLQTRGLLADLPLTESGELDETTFSAAVDTAATAMKEALAGNGGGEVRGFGAPVGGDTAVGESRRTTNPWGRSLTESKGA